MTVHCRRDFRLCSQSLVTPSTTSQGLCYSLRELLTEKDGASFEEGEEGGRNPTGLCRLPSPHACFSSFCNEKFEVIGGGASFFFCLVVWYVRESGARRINKLENGQTSLNFPFIFTEQTPHTIVEDVLG